LKKLFTIMLSFVLTIGAVVPMQNVYAATYDWTDGYFEFLYNTMNDTRVKDFTQYTVEDLNADGIPELILKNTSIADSYRIYRYEGSAVVYERQLSASSFYTADGGYLIISYGDVAGTTYIYYDADRSITNSIQLLKSRRGAQNSTGEWSWTYSYKNKDVSKEEFDSLVKSELSPAGFVFSEINEKNIREEVLVGMSFPQSKELLFYSGEKNNAGTDVKISLRGNSVESKVNGESLIYGLLMINGVFVNNAFPINQDGSTLVPVRAVSEGLNASVEWISALQKIKINKSGISIEMYVNEDFAIVNGQRKQLSVAPTIINGSTYVPVRFVAENLDCNVNFDGGKGSLLPIISIDNKPVVDYHEIEEDEALAKVKYIIKNVDWSWGKGTLYHAYRAEKVSLKSEGLILDRFWVINLDIKEAQKILVDKYTGHVYSMYEYGNRFGISIGVEALIEAMQYTY